jgi:hypothetical protein
MDTIQIQRQIMGRLNIQGLLALAGVIGPLALLIGNYTPALTTPGYNLVSDSISSLALTPLGWVQTIGFLTVGLLVEIYVFALLFSIKPRRGFGIGIVLMVIFGFGILMLAAFRTNLPGILTFEGDIHGIVSKTVFTTFPIAVGLISFSIKHDTRWKHLHVYSVGTVILGIILAVITMLAKNTNYFGLFERLLVANLVIWVEVTAIRIILLSLRTEQRVSPEFQPDD